MRLCSGTTSLPRLAYQGYLTFSWSTQLSMKFQLLIKTKAPTNEEVSCFKFLRCCIYHANSALDKLLGQLGIYATWLSSIVYLQKQLRIFIFLMPRFFFCDYMFSYCLKPSRMCLHIYSLPSSAFLKYQTSGFYCT